MALTLFSRIRFTSKLLAGPRPETGDIWKPESVSVVERYANLAGAVVLVYSSDRTTHYHVSACLGCHHMTTGSKNIAYRARYGLTDAAIAANDHASTCRALPRDIPARPDDDAARIQLHTWVLALARREEDHLLHLSDLDSCRLILQRTDDWIENELRSMAAEQPGVLSVKASKYSPGIDYTILRRPA